jgi:mannitol-specific phosphotransferase system IIBC component
MVALNVRLAMYVETRLSVIVSVMCALLSASAVLAEQVPSTGAHNDEVRELQHEVAEMSAELQAMKRAMQRRNLRSEPDQMIAQRTRGMMGRCWMGSMGGRENRKALADQSEPQVSALADVPENHKPQQFSERKKNQLVKAREVL